MIINLRFGYASRHHIHYDTERKRGTLKLWSPHVVNSMAGVDNGESHAATSSNSTLRRETLVETLFRDHQQTEFMIADEPDLIFILTALIAMKNGLEFSFLSREGRKITFSLKRQGKTKKDAITVQIQYGKAAKLTMGEAHKLQTIMMDILYSLGYSSKEIFDRLESLRQAEAISRT